MGAGRPASWATSRRRARVEPAVGAVHEVQRDAAVGGSQAARSRSACSLSMTKCTARTVVGRRLLAYRSAAMVARSKSSTKTMTTRRV